MKTLSVGFILSFFLVNPLVHANSSVLLEIALQVQNSTQNFNYNTSPLLSVGQLSKLPVKGNDSQNFELHLTPQLKKAAPRDIVEIEMELFQNLSSIPSKSLMKSKVITRLHESAAIEERDDNGHKILFTVTPIEIQNR